MINTPRDLFRVQGPGYRATFISQADAENDYERLEKALLTKSRNSGDAFRISLMYKLEGQKNWRLEKSLNINEDYPLANGTEE